MIEIYVKFYRAGGRDPESPRPYPLPEFWRTAARHGVKAVVNSDAHAPEVLDAYLENGYALARECGVEVLNLFGECR